MLTNSDRVVMSPHYIICLYFVYTFLGLGIALAPCLCKHIDILLFYCHTFGIGPPTKKK